MAEIVQNNSETGTAALVRGIVKDAEELLAAQIALFRSEIRDEVRKGKDAVLALAIGAALTLAGVAALIFTLGYLLPWLWPELPVWAGFAIVTAVVLAIGVSIMVATKRKLASIKPEKTLATLEENIRWMAKK